MSAEPILSIQNLSKLFQIGRKRASNIREIFSRLGSNKVKNDFWALEDISFDIHKGEVVGIIGKNGAGKSTLLKILSRITPLTSGRVEISGRVASLLEVGTGFHAELTGIQNIYLNGAILGMTRSEIKGKMDEIVEFAGIGDFLYTPVKHYSSGMYVRLAFAVAAHLEPDILIVDEVLAVGDIEFQNKCLGKMQEVSQNSGRTILFVSHNLVALKSLCSRGIVLDHGRITFDGEITKAVDSYLAGTELIQSKETIKESSKHLGSGEIKIIDIKISFGSDNQICTGDDVQFDFYYQIENLDFNFNGCHIGVIIYDSNQNTVISHSNRHIGEVFTHDQFKHGNCISFVIRKLPLKSGKYWLSYNIVDQNRYMDSMENAISFEVLPGLIYNYVQEVNAGLVGVHADWSLGQIN